jgi:ATP-binding cassette, subfamily B, bacterial PglK
LVIKSIFADLRKINSILLARERNKGYIFIAYMFISMFLETLGIGLIAPLIKAISDPNILISNNYLSGIIQLLEIDNFKSLILTFSFGLVIIYLFKNAFLTYFTWFKLNYLSNLRMNLSNRLLKVYLTQPYTFHLQNNSGQLIQNTLSEVTVFTGRLLGPMVVILTESLVLFGIAILLFFIEPIGASFVILLIGFVAKLMLLITRKRIIRWGKERQYHDGKKIQHLQQGLGGVKDALILGKIQYFLDQFKIHNLLSRRPDQKQAFVQEIPRFFFEVLAVIGLVMIIIIMSFQEKEFSSILATLGIFGAAAFRIMPSITRIIAAIQSVRYGYPVLEKLYCEFKLKESSYLIDSRVTIDNFAEQGKELIFDNVTFSYPNSSQPSLKNASLSIMHGDCIGIVGASGAGKSTLVDILLGLLKSDDGKVLVNHKDIHKSLSSWQSQIGYVPQFIYLTDDTLRKNIAFGVAEDMIDNDSIDKAINAAQLSDFIKELPYGVNTKVGERGTRLSGGQRQRIGIARALYNNPNIIVFDEATSSLDYSTEKRIMETVYELNKYKTIIIIAHRLSTLEYCDRIYRLESGIVTEETDLDKLLNQN